MIDIQRNDILNNRDNGSLLSLGQQNNHNNIENSLELVQGENQPFRELKKNLANYQQKTNLEKDLKQPIYYMRQPQLSTAIGSDKQELNNHDYFDQSTGILYQKLLDNP